MMATFILKMKRSVDILEMETVLKVNNVPLNTLCLKGIEPKHAIEVSNVDFYIKTDATSFMKE